MKTISTISKLIAMAIVFALPVSYSIWNLSAAEAAATRIHSTGVFTLVGGSIARISVVNVGQDRNITVSSIQFFDHLGSLVTSTPQGVELAPGHSTFFDLGPLNLPPGQQLQVRAVVRVQVPPDKGREPRFIASLQTLQVIVSFEPPITQIAPPQNINADAAETLSGG